MRQRKSSAYQSGVVLVLGLLLLVTITLIGIATMGSTHIQERMAGNAQLQALAFEAASAGVGRSLDFWEAQSAEHDLECDKPFHEGWDPETTGWSDPVQIGSAELQQRLRCVGTPCKADDADECLHGRRSKLFVENRGLVFAGDDVRVAQREIAVRLTREFTEGQNIPVRDCGALCFPQCDGGNDTVNVTGGGTLTADGEAGPAITVACQELLDTWEDETDAKRQDNLGGFAVLDSDQTPRPWDDLDNLSAFRDVVKAQAYAAGDSCAGGRGSNQTASCYHSGDVTESGNLQFGTEDTPRITYIDGDASMGGNIRGAGILFVDGNLSWQGTPQFDGLIVVTGGTMGVDSGGGGGGDHAGTVVVLNAPEGASNFGPTHFNVTGGGNAKFNFNCKALEEVRGLLNQAGQDLWDPGCGGDGEGEVPGEDWFGEFRIESWRENIGWREDI